MLKDLAERLVQKPHTQISGFIELERATLPDKLISFQGFGFETGLNRTSLEYSTNHWDFLNLIFDFVWGNRTHCVWRLWALGVKKKYHRRAMSSRSRHFFFLDVVVNRVSLSPGGRCRWKLNSCPVDRSARFCWLRVGFHKTNNKRQYTKIITKHVLSVNNASL